MDAPFRLTPMKSMIFTLSTLLALAALSGCVGDAPGDNGSHLYVKDALTDDVKEVHVTFTKAQVKAENAGWTTVFEGKQSIELLSLSAADAKEQLAAFDLQEGAYEGLRIAVSEVTVVDHDGVESMLNVFGNLVQVSNAFTVGADGIDILVDFDLEEGVDLESGQYTPIIKNVQLSTRDADNDGKDDVKDTDDDNDGKDDNEDDDIDGDGEDDKPAQYYGASEAEICEAELDDELAELEAEFAEELMELEEELTAVLEDESMSDDERIDAMQELDAEIMALEREMQKEIRELEDELDECLTEEDDDEDEADDEMDAAECIEDAREELMDLEEEFMHERAELESEMMEVMADNNATEEERQEAQMQFEAQVAELELAFSEERAELEAELDACEAALAAQQRDDETLEDSEDEHESSEEEEAETDEPEE